MRGVHLGSVFAATTGAVSGMVALLARTIPPGNSITPRAPLITEAEAAFDPVIKIPDRAVMMTAPMSRRRAWNLRWALLDVMGDSRLAKLHNPGKAWYCRS